MLIPWIARARRAQPYGFWPLKIFLVLCAIAFLLPVPGIWNVRDLDLGNTNMWTVAICTGSILLPAAAILAFLFAVDAWRSGAGRWLRTYAFAVSTAALIISGYLSAWGMIGFTPWNF